MILKEIEINQVLGVESVRLCFDKETIINVCYILQCENLCPIRKSFCTAIQLICNARYAHVESLAELKDIHRGWIRMVFLIPKRGFDENREAFMSPLTGDKDALISDIDEDDLFDDDTPCTSQQARIRELQRQRYLKKRAEASKVPYKYYKIEACRNFTLHPELVTYSVDDGPTQSCPLPSFHGKFFTNVDYVLPKIDKFPNEFSKNWLQVLTTELNDKWNYNENIGNPFDDFMYLFLKKRYNRQHFMMKLTHSCFIGKATLRSIQKSIALRILQDVRKIFEFITYDEFTTWFLIPYAGQMIDLHEIEHVLKSQLDDAIDIDGMKTYIQLKSSMHKKTFLWTDADEATQDLLLISLQLALAFHCRQHVIYLQKMDSIKNYQVIQHAAAAYLHVEASLDISWSQRNYVQRIIDVCGKLGVTAIIEYPGGMPGIVKNAITLKCQQMDEEGGKWTIKISDADSNGMDGFIEAIKQNWKFF